jgi:outer membrane protein
MTLCGAAALSSCQIPLDNLDVVLERHERAVARLPEEQQMRLMPYGPAVTGERAASIVPDGELTIDAARALAVRTNPDIHAAQARFEQALARVSEARSRYYPNLVATHTSTRTFEVPANRNRLANAASSLQGSSTFPTDLNSPPAVLALINAIRRPFFREGGDGDTNSFSEHATSLTSSWLLFDGFVREAQLMATKYLHRASTYALLDAQRLLVRSVDAAYYQVQLAREQIRIAIAAEEFSREQFVETGKLQSAGRASVADVDNFRVRMLAAQAELAGARGLHESGRVILAELMGIEGAHLPANIELSPLAEESEAELAAPAVEDFMAEATANRPDLRQLEELVRSEEEHVRAAYGLYQPVILMTGSWGFNRTSNLRYEVDDQSSAAGLEVRWELFNGGAREALIRVAESVQAESCAVLARQRLSVESEVRRAVIDVQNSQEQIHLQRENLATAHENRRIVQAGYQGGKEPLTRLNEAQRDYITSDANLALARIRLRQAWSDLRAASAIEPGRKDEAAVTPPPQPSP